MPSIELTDRWFAGVVSLEEADGGVLPFRLRSADRDLLFPELAARAEMASGVRIELDTDATAVTLDLHWAFDANEGERHFVDVTSDGDVAASQEVQQGRQTIAFDDLPAGQKRLAIWLPQFGKTIVHGLAINDGATACPRDASRRKRWMTYGSSITHCRTAYGPARTWPATVARLQDVNLTSLGFGGQCHFDPLVGRTIRDLPADFISLKLGINTHGAPTFSQRSWAQAVIGLLLTIRDGHPETPLLIVSPIYSFDRETQAPPSGHTLADMRKVLADLVDRFRGRGDSRIHYLDGLQLLGADDAHLMPDGLHPNGEGYELMGRRFSQVAFGPGGPFAC